MAAPDAPRTSGMSAWQLNYCRNLFSLQIYPQPSLCAFLGEKSWGEKVNVNNRFRLDSNLKQLFKIPFHSKVDFNKVFLTEYKKSSDLNLI